MHLTTLSPAPAHPLPPPVPSLPGRTLVVDDNEAIRTFLRYFFKLENLPVEIVASGPAALERLRAAPKDFALMITDCEMPGMTGLELGRRLQAETPDLKVLYLTGHSDALFEERPILGANEAFVDKPVSPKGLHEAVSLALYGHLAGLTVRAGSDEPAASNPGRQQTTWV